MSLQTRITALAQAIAGDVKTLLANQGSLAALTTTQKSSLVAAINELKTAVSGSSGILDSGVAGATTTTWSTDKIISSIAALKTEILGGASVAFDTLKEIETQLGSDGTALGNLLTAVGNRVRFDVAQTLTAEQITQACANLGLGEPETDLAAVYAAAKA